MPMAGSISLKPGFAGSCWRRNASMQTMASIAPLAARVWPKNLFVLENGGTVLWTGAGGFYLSNAVITNRAGALFQAANAASLAFNGGVSRFDNAGTFRKTAGGTTTVNSGVAFNNYNTVDIRTGILAAV